ncbi:MAG: inositol monophosphatase [Desulfovibrio sp.]|nr:inositol monophosphatase [Desulfovibrio sp.]
MSMPTPLPPAQALAPGLLECVRQAGDLIRAAWHQPSTVQHKGRIDLVTETDLAVEAALKASLTALCPQVDFLAEESADGVDRAAVLAGPCWVIDPLDGTTNFAHRLPFVAVSVGLWTGSGVDLAAVYNPVLDEMFHAVRGGGAFRNGRPMAVSGAARLQDSLVCTGFPYASAEDAALAARLAGWIQRMLATTRGLRRYGAAALDLAYVAAGHYEAFYELGLKPWDVAAGWLLVEEAGGRVTPIPPILPIPGSPGSPDSPVPFTLDAPSILATNGQVHQAMLEQLTA